MGENFCIKRVIKALNIICLVMIVFSFICLLFCLFKFLDHKVCKVEMSPEEKQELDDYDKNKECGYGLFK